jgi:transposase
LKSGRPDTVSRRKKDPLRLLTPEETETLTRLSRAQSVPASHVIRARLLLAVAAGLDYTQAAKSVGRKDRDCVSGLVSLFNRDGLQSVVPGHGGGFQPRYTEAEKARILEEFKRVPDRKVDQTASWTLSTLQRALRRAPDGLPTVSTYTLRIVLNEAGYTWQKDRTWCQTGQVERKRKHGIVTVVDPDAEAKKS